MVCNSYKSNDSDDINVTSCHVSHSSNTVPLFNCSRNLPDSAIVTTEIRQKEAICPLDNTAYNSTAFTVNENYLQEPLECTVTYQSLIDPSSTTYLTEHFVVPRKVEKLDVQDTTLQFSTGTSVCCLLIGLYFEERCISVRSLTRIRYPQLLHSSTVSLKPTCYTGSSHSRLSPLLMSAYIHYYRDSDI